jgi:hypothetical protein
MVVDEKRGDTFQKGVVSFYFRTFMNKDNTFNYKRCRLYLNFIIQFPFEFLHGCWKDFQNQHSNTLHGTHRS